MSQATKNDHYAVIEPSSALYEVSYKGQKICESNQVMIVKEFYQGRALPEALYFPFDSLSNLALLPSEHTSECPIKGVATYYNFQDSENGIWSYTSPLENLSQIKAYYGFDKNKGFAVIRK